MHVNIHTNTHTHTHTYIHTHLHDHRSGNLSNIPSFWGTSLEPYRFEESSCIFCLMVCIWKTFKTAYFFILSRTRFRSCQTLRDTCYISTLWDHVFCINVMGDVFYMNVMGSRVLYIRSYVPVSYVNVTRNVTWLFIWKAWITYFVHKHNISI